MLCHEDPFTIHCDAVEAMAAAGIAPPPEWVKVRQRFEEYTYLTSPALERLSAAVMVGSADIATLRALALAEVTAMPPNKAQVTNVVRAAVLTKLGDVYSPVAHGNYKKLAEAFTSTAQKFTEAAGVIDPETEALLIVGASEPERLAWIAALEHAHQLTRQLTALQAAAQLAGTVVTKQEQLLPLAVDPSGSTAGNVGKHGNPLRAAPEGGARCSGQVPASARPSWTTSSRTGSPDRSRKGGSRSGAA